MKPSPYDLNINNARTENEDGVETLEDEKIALTWQYLNAKTPVHIAR